MNLLQQITRATAERQDPESIFQVVVSTLEDRLPADFVAIWTFETEVVELASGIFGTKAHALAPQLCGETPARRGLDPAGLEPCLAGQLIYEEDASRAAAPLLLSLAELGLRSVTLASLRADNKAVGLLVASRRQPANFTSGECEFLQQLSENVALAAFHAKLHKALEKAYEDAQADPALGRGTGPAAGARRDGERHRPQHQQFHFARRPPPRSAARTGRRFGGEGPRPARGRAAGGAGRGADGRPHAGALPRPGGETQTSRVQLDLLVEQVVELTSSKWRDTPQESGIVIAVEKRLGAGAAAIRGRHDQLREALIQLIFNAVDAMPRGGSLVLATGVSSAARPGSSRPDGRSVSR